MKSSFESPPQKEKSFEQKRKAALAAVGAGATIILNIIKPSPASAALNMDRTYEGPVDTASIEEQLAGDMGETAEKSPVSAEMSGGILNHMPQVGAGGWVDEYLDQGYEITGIQTIGEILLVSLSDGKENQIIACNLEDSNIDSSSLTSNQDREQRLSAIEEFMKKPEINDLQTAVKKNLKKTLELGLIPDFENLKYEYDQDRLGMIFFRKNNNNIKEYIIITVYQVRFITENEKTFHTFIFDEDDTVTVKQMFEKENENYHYPTIKTLESKKLDIADVESMGMDVFKIF